MAVVYLEGSMIKASSTFKDAAGVIVDPPEVVLKYKKPDESVVTKAYSLSEITKVSAGNYETYVLLADPGKYTFRWEGTGNSGSVSETTINVTASKVV